MYNLPVVSFLDKLSGEKIKALQKELSLITGSLYSMHAWQPHLTVGSQIYVDEKQLDDVSRKFFIIASDTRKITIQTSGFGFYETWPGGVLPDHSPYVAYVKLEKPKELDILSQKIKQVTDMCETSYDQPWPYEPHITLAYKDLTREGLERSIDYLQNKKISIQIIIDHFLLVQKTDNKWQELRRFPFR